VLCSAVLDIAHNAFSRLAHEPDKLREAYYSAMGMASATSMPIFFLLSFVAPELTVSVFGKPWAGAAMVMTPLLMLGGVQVLQFFNGILYNAIGRPGIGLYFMVGKTVVTVGILYLAKDMGFDQVVWAYFISQIISTPVSFYVAKRVMGISFRRVFEQIWPFALATLAAASVVYGVRSLASTGMPIADLVLLLAVGGLTYLLTAVATAKERVLLIINTLRNRRAEPN
jgi:O-antigen/teichoic acid export membrane protein